MIKGLIRINSLERAVGLFTLSTAAIVVVLLVSLAIRQAWFQDVVVYHTYYDAAEGLNPGTPVLVGGIKAGQVKRVEIDEDNRIHVFFAVKERYAERIRQDSVAQIARQFVIGEKQVNITLGSHDKPHQPNGGLIKGEEYVELADLLSGRKMAPFLKVLESIFGYMSEIIDQLNSSAERFDMIGLTRELVPALRNGRDAFARVKNMQEQLELMNREIGTMRKEFFLSQNMKSLLGHANDAAAEFAVFTRTMNRLEPQLSRAMHDLAKITPEMAKASPEFARIAEDSIKTLREMIVTMKAMQKSWFLRDHVKDARDEERMPAGQPSAPKGK